MSTSDSRTTEIHPKPLVTARYSLAPNGLLLRREPLPPTKQHPYVELVRANDISLPVTYDSHTARDTAAQLLGYARQFYTQQSLPPHPARRSARSQQPQRNHIYLDTRSRAGPALPRALRRHSRHGRHNLGADAGPRDAVGPRTPHPGRRPGPRPCRRHARRSRRPLRNNDHRQPHRLGEQEDRGRRQRRLLADPARSARSPRRRGRLSPAADTDRRPRHRQPRPVDHPLRPTPQRGRDTHPPRRGESHQRDRGPLRDTPVHVD
ncbi:hypothetical protein SAMN04489733_8050 [Amycolatopsis keratiniphila]|nr:hypothetical protein SAMN04489733_8050 [Amycolatopsis keratiniphila]